MATVQYKVMYRLLHPVTSTPIKNQYPDEYIPYGVVMEGVVQSTTSAAAPTRVMKAFNFGVGTTQVGDLRDPSIRPELAAIIGSANPDLPRQIELKFIEKRNQSSNHMYDSLFYFNATKHVYTKIQENQYNINQTTYYNKTHYDMYADLFTQVIGEPWFVHSVHGSFNSALESAKKLTNNIGLANVSLHKVVPLGMQVVIE